MFALVGAWALAPGERPEAPRPSLALFTSLPLYWAEAADVGAALRGDSPPHWARTALERDWRLQPVDRLDPAGLAPHRRLLLAQPRPLAPDENVALDHWVAGGGRLLLFADPALTAASGFALGDRRRPQEVVLLSPILARWGLELRYDERQPLAGRRVHLAPGADLPVRLAGGFAVHPQPRRRQCRLVAQTIVARCRIGRGTVVAVADAALLEQPADDPDAAMRETALARLSAWAFVGKAGENTGRQ